MVSANHRRYVRSIEAEIQARTNPDFKHASGSSIPNTLADGHELLLLHGRREEVRQEKMIMKTHASPPAFRWHSRVSHSAELVAL